jgi:hypothetical protein
VLRELLAAGHEAVVFDNLSNGHARAAEGASLVVGDILDAAALDDCFRRGPFVFQGFPGPGSFPPGRGQLVLDFTIKALALGLHEVDIGRLGIEPGLALLQGVPDGTEQHHVEEKDQD